MASLSRTALRLRHLQRCRCFEAARGLHTSMRRSAATNFSMPALSPTMTEGTIGTWKVKEGDSFATGDVILEIETDKAQMDVEAPEDGIMAKILVDSGTKNVKVGTRLAVLAEPDDDISSLEFPPDESAVAQESAPAKPKSEPEAPKQQESKPSPPPSEKPKPVHNAPKTPFTPSPSVAHLLKEHGITDASSIQASGPRGRLLKGDILAHLGKIQSSRPQELEESIYKLGKLDLSNIKVKKTEPAKASKNAEAAAAAQKAEQPKEKTITVPLALTGLLEGFATSPPSKEDISRINSLLRTSYNKKANAGLPSTKESVDDIFDELIGKKSKSKAGTAKKDGHFEAQFVWKVPEPRSADVYDILTGKVSARARPSVSTGRPILTVTVPPNEDPKRAEEFLNRAASFLEVEVLTAAAFLSTPNRQGESVGTSPSAWR